MRLPRKESLLGLLIIVTLILAMQVTVIGTKASPTTTVWVAPPRIVDGTKGVGTTFKFWINVTDAIDLYTVGIKVRWWGPVLNVTRVDEGPFLKSGGSTFPSKQIFNKPDSIGISDYAILGDTLVGAASGVTGDGTLFNVTCLVEADPGKTAFDLYDVELRNSRGVLIENVVVEDGYFANVTWDEEGYPGDVDGQPTDAPAGEKGYGAMPRDVDLEDLMILARAMGHSGDYLANPVTWPPPWGVYNSAADLNDDGRVDTFDLWLVGTNYGQPL